MIAVRLEGGLGNQMFQYAAARSLALRHNTEVLIDRSALCVKKKTLTLRGYELGIFNCKASFPIGRNIDFQKYAKYFPKIFNLFSSWNVLLEDGDCFNKSFFSAPDDSYLIGYWQSYKYFENIKKILRSEFVPKIALSLDSLKVKKLIDESSVAIAIHVRRGDYVSLPSAANYHGSLPLDYYCKGIEIMKMKFPNSTYFVFSDDIDWCKSDLALGERAVYVDHNKSTDAWQDLVLMSSCHHHIIANSSFSWWGAWLGNQGHTSEYQTVIYPKNWFKGRAVNAEDRFPSSWLGV